MKDPDPDPGDPKSPDPTGSGSATVPVLGPAVVAASVPGPRTLHGPQEEQRTPWQKYCVVRC